MSAIIDFHSEHSHPNSSKLSTVLELNNINLDKYTTSALLRVIEEYEAFKASPAHEQERVLGFLVLPITHKCPAPPTYNCVPFKLSGAKKKSDDDIIDDETARTIVDQRGADLVKEFEKNKHKIPKQWTTIDCGVFARYIGKVKEYYLATDVIHSAAVKAGMSNHSGETQHAYVFQGEEPGRAVVIGHEQLNLPTSSNPLTSAKDWLHKQYTKVVDFVKSKRGSYAIPPIAPATIPVHYTDAGGRFTGFAKDLAYRIKAPQDPYANQPAPTMEEVQELERKLLDAYSGGSRDEFEKWCASKSVEELYEVNEWMRHLIAYYYRMNLSRYETRFTTDQLAHHIDTANNHIYSGQSTQ